MPNELRSKRGQMVLSVYILQRWERVQQNNIFAKESIPIDSFLESTRNLPN